MTPEEISVRDYLLGSAGSPEFRRQVLLLARAYQREAYEDAARIAERIWDEGLEGGHGGEQANRTAAAIRARAKETA
jgi:hypothetical protein